MSVSSDLVDAVVTRIQTVPNVGLVYNRLRWSANTSDYLDLFTSSIGGQVQTRAWMARWGGVEDAWDDPSAFGRLGERYVVLVMGIQSFKDSTSSSRELHDLAELVKDAINTRKDFDLANVVDYSVKVTVDEPDVRQFGSVLCDVVNIKVAFDVVRAVTFA